MARTRIIEAPVFKSWEDVDRALKEIAAEEITLSDIEGDMNKQIAGVKLTAAQEAKPHQDRISKLGGDIKEFVTAHRDELGKQKTKNLNFGKTGFRQSTSVSLPKAKEKIAEIVRKLKSRKMVDCIITTENINKDLLRQYGEDKVMAVGATWKQTDTFWYEAARDKLEKIQAEGL